MEGVTMEVIVDVQQLTKRYNSQDAPAVDGISFQIREGEIFSLLGPNAAGKTTTISMLSCLLQPSAGDALVDGRSVTREPMRVKEVIGVVPQEVALYDRLTGRQNLSFWGRMYDLGGKELQGRADEVLEITGLRERADDRVESYSGGMKRRLNIGVGLLHRPRLIFMDEPTVGIDPQSRRKILDTVKDLNAEGMTVLYTTHYMEEAQELSDRVAIMDHGRVIALGAQPELTELVGENETLRLHLPEGQSGAALAEALMARPEVIEVSSVDGQVAVIVPAAEEALPGVINAANELGVRIRSIDIEEPNLEAVFLHLTGRGLRD
jgi:ABC-2 type transport system ATP-binding protein